MGLSSERRLKHVVAGEMSEGSGEVHAGRGATDNDAKVRVCVV
jgi:hypothetical protein